MTAKEELKQYKYARERVNEALSEYQKYKTRAEKMTSMITGEPKGSGGKSDKVGDNVAIMLDLEKEYEQRWINAEKEKLRLEHKIDRIEEPYRTLLHKKYIQEKSLEEISCDMKCNYTYACEQHGKALKLYEENRTNPKTTEE